MSVIEFQNYWKVDFNINSLVFLTNDTNRIFHECSYHGIIKFMKRVEGNDKMRGCAKHLVACCFAIVKQIKKF